MLLCVVLSSMRYRSHAGMCESRIPLVRVSVNEARCSVRRTTGAERLMCSGSWAPRSLCKRLCRPGALEASLSSDRFAGGCARAMRSARSASSSLAGYPEFLLVHAPIMKQREGSVLGHTHSTYTCVGQLPSTWGMTRFRPPWRLGSSFTLTRVLDA